ncbi:MAG: HEAT repeat domain-containing protein, partial [Myxococcales bacterium]|nr:HEAT repeat domain-containing protein [Myxococcales bacterium]
MARENILRKVGLGKVTSVADLGIGSWFAKTRGRLATSALVATALMFIYCIATATYIRQSSTSIVANLFIITGGILIGMVTLYLQALLVGDLTFPGEWRRRVVLGEKVELREEEDLTHSIGTLSDHTARFYLTLALLAGLNYGAVSLATGNFLGEYSSYGFKLTMLRSPDAEIRREALRSLANPLIGSANEAELVRQTVISLAMSDPDENVRQWALWIIGEMQYFEAISPLRGLLENDAESDEIRASAAEALGVLSNDTATRMMAELLADAFGRNRFAIGLLRGIGLSERPDAAAFVEPMLSVDENEVRAHAYWALGHSGDLSYREPLLRRLEEGDTTDRCFVAEALKFLVQPEDRLAVHGL